MLYVLERVTDLKHADKKDEASLNRIGRIFDVDFEDSGLVDYPFLPCEYPGYHKSVILSKIKSITKSNTGYIVETMHSIYYFSRYTI